MGWEFEHWEDGKVYLHMERWMHFRHQIEHNGCYPHNWDHTRMLLKIHSPREKLHEVPCPGLPELKHLIEKQSNWSTIYDFYPAFVRTIDDPEGWLPSFHLWVEDKHKKPFYGESLSLFETGPIDDDNGGLLYAWNKHRTNKFAYFQDKYWLVEYSKDYGLGSNEPPPPPSKPKSRRSIFEPFENSW